MRRIFQHTLAAALSCLALALPAVAADPAPGPFATVDGKVITAEEFNAAVRDGARNKFYHGEIPPAAMARFQREIGERLVQTVLLSKEAKRRGIEPDPDWVKPRLDAFERRYSKHQDWEKQREQLLRAADEQLRVQSRIRNLRELVREQAGTPSADALRTFYDANHEKFTEPERFRISTILLKVEPSAPGSVWRAATAEASALVERLRAGEDFAELARLHSGDASAERGGDMGYLHRGMLGASAEAAVDAAEIGKVLDPIRLLEGIAIFRVDDRPVPKLRPFDAVTERARELWLRERRASVWNDFLQGLMKQADIQINEQHYLPLPG